MSLVVLLLACDFGVVGLRVFLLWLCWLGGAGSFALFGFG